MSTTADAPANTDYWTDEGNYADDFAGGYGTETDPYLISNAAQLAYLAYQVNTLYETYSGEYFLQTADIDLSAHYWDAIGFSSLRYFAGHYDGGGYTISGLFTPAGSSSTYSYQGLFGYVYGTSSPYATISNVGIVDSNIQGYQYVGAIAGYARYATISNCYNTGSVTSSTSSSTYSYVGGVVGYNYSSYVYNCYNTGSVSGSSTSVGGVVGSNSSSYVYNSYNTGSVTGSGTSVGGVVGSNSSSYVYNSYNTGTVSGSSYVGGVVGYNNSSSYVYNCHNTGSVTGSGNFVGGVVGYNNSSSYVYNSYNTGSVTSNSSYSSYVGGVVGINASSYVYNSYNTGSVTGSSSYVGGVVGYNNIGSVYNSYNTGSVSGYSYVGGVVGSNFGTSSYYAYVYNSYNTGSVSGTSYVGGVVGSNYNTYSYVYNCYYGGNCTLSSDVGGGYTSSTYVSNCGEMTVEEAKTLSWYTNNSNWYEPETYPWDFTYTWVLDSTQNDGYPTFLRITITYFSNDGTNQTFTETQYANAAIIAQNTFSRTGYSFSSWNANSIGTGVVYTAGETYQIASSIDLYAQWEPNVYTITLNHENGDNSTTIYVKYATGFYSNNTASDEITSVNNIPTMKGYSFLGYYTEQNGAGTQAIDENGNIVISTTYLADNYELYAYWTPNVPAYYDEDNGYWYIEYGSMPQTKVTDTAVLSELNNGNYSTSGNIYYFAGFPLASVVTSDGTEYCYIFGNWYKVEPIRWIIYSNSTYTTGSYIEVSSGGSVYMVTESVVNVGRYSTFPLGVDQGYADAQNESSFSFVDNFLLNFDSEDLLEFSVYVDEFSSSGTTSISMTSRIFLSSNEEIYSVHESYAVSMSDLVSDYLAMEGNGTYYFTRDLGTNLNNVVVHTSGGGTTNKKPNTLYGMCFTVKFTEFVCL